MAYKNYVEASSKAQGNEEPCISSWTADVSSPSRVCWWAWDDSMQGHVRFTLKVWSVQHVQPSHLAGFFSLAIMVFWTTQWSWGSSKSFLSILCLEICINMMLFNDHFRQHHQNCWMIFTFLFITKNPTQVSAHVKFLSHILNKFVEVFLDTAQHERLLDDEDKDSVPCCWTPHVFP